MILLDIATDLKENYGYEDVPVNDLVNVLRDGFTAISNDLIKEATGSVIQIPRFGSFRIEKRDARIGRNPKTGEKLNIPAKNVVKFRPSSLFRQGLEEAKIKETKKEGGKNKSSKKKGGKKK